MSTDGSTFRIYVASYCPYCTAAKDLLRRKGYAFEEIDVTHDFEARRELAQRTGRRTVPQIFRGEEHIGGYDDLVRYFAEGAS